MIRDVVSRRAPAKLNLALSVGPPRASDGLHPISSWFASIDLYDELKVTRLEDDRLSRYAILWHDEAPRPTTIDWSITKDLAVRAHRALEEVVGRSLPVQMKLDKRIPVGGGLGGGSSDAAAMLLAVRELFDLEIEDQELARLGLELGSDVPFFLQGGSALVSGVGGEIEAMPAIEGGAVALIVPTFSCATGAVYRAFDEGDPGEVRHADVRAMAGAGKVDPDSLFNDLAPAAAHVAPSLNEVREKAQRLVERPVHVTGSGSAMFIVCPAGRFEAESLATRLGPELDDCVMLACRFG